MKIKDFIDKVENLCIGCSMETRVCCDYYDTIPQWIDVERYTFKDENGEDVILKINPDNSYHTDSVRFNVMACFDMSGDEFDSYYHSLSNMMNYLQKSLDDGEMCEDDELYIIYGQSVGDDNLYEIFSKASTAILITILLLIILFIAKSLSELLLSGLRLNMCFVTKSIPVPKYISPILVSAVYFVKLGAILDSFI